MSQLAPLERHAVICDLLHQCVMDENRHLRQHQRAPDSSLIERKRKLLEQLESTLANLRTEPAASVRDPSAKEDLERTRARILQILQLDKENEQLLLRCSLASARSSGGTTPTAPPLTMLQRIYARCS